MAAKSLRGPILVVDDDEDMRDALVAILEGEGYAVTAAGEGNEALACLRGTPRPSLVLLDLMMPCVDGFDLRVQQLQDPALADIPVIVVSAGADLGRKVAALQVDDHLTKPVDMSRLLALVERRCARTDAQPPGVRTPTSSKRRSRSRGSSYTR